MMTSLKRLFLLLMMNSSWEGGQCHERAPCRARELDALVVVIMIELRQQHHRVWPLYRLRVWLLCSTAAARRPPCATFFKSNGLSAPDRRSHGHQLPKNEVSSSRHLRHRPGRFCPRYRVQRWNCRQCLSLTDFHFWN